MSLHRSMLIGWVSLSGLLGTPPASSAPVISNSPFHQSPVHAAPDELLLLPGYGFADNDTVMYQRLEQLAQPLTAPNALPDHNSVEQGIAEIVSAKHAPYSLTVRLPETFQANQTYALWVRDAMGAWSNAALVNDARPLWSSPAYVHGSELVAGLPRELKIIGRNLQPAPGHATQIRLRGPQDHVLVAVPDTDSAVLDEYVARVLLPPQLVAGEYHIAVNRDGRNWLPLTGQTLQVRNNPAVSTAFPIDSPAYGSCHANDGRDDSSCLQLAINAASKAGGGNVILGAGQWDLGNDLENDLGNDLGNGLSAPTNHGRRRAAIQVPRNVNLTGAGSNATSLVRHTNWNQPIQLPALILLGANRISGFRFHDSQQYSHRNQAAAFLVLGAATTDTLGKTPAVSDVIITDNVFDQVMLALADNGASIRRLFITHNEFGAYHAALRLSGDSARTGSAFHLEDSVIAYNHFHPGSWLDVLDRQGTLASELGAGLRVDVSHNFIDGASTRYLNSPDDARGWRAGFFWHLNDNQEQLLVSQNTFTCTGDKAGDGEAIALDNNGNTFGVDSVTTVIAASRDSLTINGPLISTQGNQAINSDLYYRDHWVQIGAGPGLGQARKIVGYQQERSTGRITIKVSPAWDVIPEQNSRMSIGREFWQVYVLANQIDHRQPLCQKSNRNAPKGGGISLFAQMADSVVAGNRQLDTDGVLLQTQYTTRSNDCKDCYRGTFFNSFIDIHHNLIEGEYDWNRDCSSSGILNSLAASPNTAPLTTSYGLNIAHNIIRHADAWQGGAIAMSPSWYQGPAPYRWPLVASALIQHNHISDMWSGAASSCGQKTDQRTGIDLNGSSLVWHSVLYANACSNVPQALAVNNAPQGITLCKPEMPDACECSRRIAPTKAKTEAATSTGTSP